jgi:hypothetical protein
MQVTNAPSIKPGDWITVGIHDCVVRKVYKPNSMLGKGQVVFNADKPTMHDIEWDINRWFFPERPDFGGYARPRDPYAQQLKQGRIAKRLTLQNGVENPNQPARQIVRI